MGTYVRIIERWLQHPIVGGPSCPSTSFLDIGDRWSQFGGWQRLRGGATTGCPSPLPPFGIAYVVRTYVVPWLPPPSLLNPRCALPWCEAITMPEVACDLFVEPTEGTVEYVRGGRGVRPGTHARTGRFHIRARSRSRFDKIRLYV